jgi:alpha/beta superfamily hydrolase
MSAVRFTTSDGIELVGELREPEGEPRGAAVLCHPHPRHGGSKDHPLLWAIRNELAGRRGLVVLSFNFRGIMGSGGEHGGGEEEVLDVAAAVERVRQQTRGPLAIVGWSFGSVVGLRYALTDPEVAALVLLGVPLSDVSVTMPEMPSRSDLAAVRSPVLIVVGEADQFCPVPDARRLASRFPNAEVAVLPDTDHFFWHREREAAERIGDFVKRALGGTGPQ